MQYFCIVVCVLVQTLIDWFTSSVIAGSHVLNIYNIDIYLHKTICDEYWILKVCIRTHNRRTEHYGVCSSTLQLMQHAGCMHCHWSIPSLYPWHCFSFRRFLPGEKNRNRVSNSRHFLFTLFRFWVGSFLRVGLVEVWQYFSHLPIKPGFQNRVRAEMGGFKDILKTRSFLILYM